MAAALVAACGRGESTSHVLEHNTIAIAPLAGMPRRFVPAEWDTLMRFATLANRASRPDKVASAGKLVVFFSNTPKQLIAVEPDGEERWRLGPALPSGDSLRRVEDLRTMSDGRIVVLDSRSNRLVMVRPDGIVESELDLASLGHLTDVVELGPGRLLLLASDTSAPFAVVSSSGRTLQHLPFPSPRYAALHTLARAGVLGSGSDGRWVFGFRLGNGLVAFRDTIPLGPVGSYPEPIRFPSVIEESRPGYRVARLGRITRTATAITVVGDRSFVLFGGMSPDRGRIIDVYRFPTSSYAYSLILPSKAVEVLSSGDDLLALMGGPEGVILRTHTRSLLRVADR